MKKGFTLVELLAVIVILAVIAFIATPTVLNMIEDARKGAFKDSVLNAYDALDYVLYKQGYSSIPSEGISIKAIDMKTDLVSGKFMRDEEGNDIAYFITNNKYCAYGKIEELIISKDCKDLDISYPELDETKLVTTSTTKTITAIIADEIAKDEETGIEKYIFELYLGNDKKGEKELKEAGTVIFENLEKNTTYKLILKAENGKEMTTTIERNVKTLDIEVATFEYEKIPEESQNGYLRSLTTKIDYNTDDMSYYVSVSSEGKINKEVTTSCEMIENKITNCKEIEATETLTKDIWYKVEKEIEITHTKESEEIGTIYALATDGVNNAIATSTVYKIDETAPEISITSTATKTDSAIVGYEITDKKSGVSADVVCKYGEEEGNYTEEAVATTKSCILSNLETDKTYYYNVCFKDVVGNSDCKKGSTKTQIITNPTIEMTNVGIAKDGYVESQIAKVTFNKTNIDNPKYYIKSEKIGTSSISINKSCGTGDLPSECKSITSTVNLNENVWYEVSGNVNITYKEASAETKTLYAITYDGRNYSGSTTGEISKMFYQASNVTYTTENNSSITNVEEALDYLYEQY